MKNQKKYTKGFTLLETILYIALLGIMLTGVIAVAYQLIGNSGKIDATNSASEEGGFFMQKLSWALSGAKTVFVPGLQGNTLSITWYDGTTIDIRQNASVIEMRENGAAFMPITTGNVVVSSLNFLYIPAAHSVPAGLEASTTVNGQSFYFKRFIRQ